MILNFARGAPLEYYNEDTVLVVSKLLFTDFIVMGTPIYQASIPGALKNLLDHLTTNALKEKVTGIVTIGDRINIFL